MYQPSIVIEDNQLKIILDRGDRQDLLEASYDENKGSDRLLVDVCESLVANGHLEWVQPEEIGALTDAPIIRSMTTDNVYWYPQYETRSPIDDLIIDGFVQFVKAD